MMAGVIVHLSNYWKIVGKLLENWHVYSEEKRVQGDRMHSSYRQTPMQTKLYSDNTERLIETAIKRLSLARINIKKISL